MKNESYFTNSYIRNVLIVLIPPLPGILVYLATRELFPLHLVNTLGGIVPLFLGVATMFAFFPLTYRITEVIRKNTGGLGE